jgi:hypothetical protein
MCKEINAVLISIPWASLYTAWPGIIIAMFLLLIILLVSDLTCFVKLCVQVNHTIFFA